MRTTGIVVVCALVLGAALIIGQAVAGDESSRPNENPKSPKVGDESVMAGDVALAHELATYGRRSKDPLALLVAARILKHTPTQAMTSSPKTYRPDDVVAKDKTESGSKPITVENLLSEARALSGEDEAFAALALAVESEQPRGREGGPSCGTFRLDPLSFQAFTEEFEASELARVVLRGDGDTDLDLFIYDENGNLIDSDTDGTDVCICEWTPRWKGPFEIRVVNLGLVWNQYQICTN